MNQNPYRRFCTHAGLLLAIAVSVGAEATQTNGAPRIPIPAWTTQVRGGVMHQPKVQIDDGGSFSLNRYYAELGITRMWRYDRAVTLSVGHGVDDYRFSSLPSDPWGSVDIYRFGLFSRWGAGHGWTFFAAPSVRSYGERGADFEDTLSAAFFGGASYRFNKRLTLGPGLGVVGQLEDDPRYFPVLVVRWDITEDLRLETGGGFAASGGPGLALSYRLPGQWKVAVGARYEKKRFRLESKRTPSRGVGEDLNFPVFADISRLFARGGRLGFIFGSGFGGKLSVDDSVGKNKYKNSYDGVPIVGFVVEMPIFY